jgi:transglutaminase-like putative cysteine protease
MPKTIVGVITGVVLAALLVWFVILPGKMATQTSQSHYDIPRQLRFNFVIHNAGNHLVRDARFFAYAPVEHTASQSLQNIDSKTPHRIETDDLGQQLMVFDLPDIPPYGRLELAYASQLMLATIPNATEDELPRVYLQPQAMIESDHPAIQSKAQALTGKDPMTSARQIYQWVADHVAYSGPSGKDRGARHALQSGRGDCTDAAFLVAALCRAAGIPTRCVGGYVCTQNKNVAASEFHNWAEFWIDGRWLVADPVNRCFADRADTYITTRIWEGKDNGGEMSFWRHRVEGKDLKVKMVG